MSQTRKYNCSLNSEFRGSIHSLLMDCSVSGFADVFDVDYFIEQTRGYVDVVKEMPPEIASKEPFMVDCSKRKGHFDYVEAVLPALLEHQYISLTPAMSQRRDRYCSII
jgi:hypothetical protein